MSKSGIAGAAFALALTTAGASFAACPNASVHPDTARLVQMGAGGQPGARAYQAAISGAQTRCESNAGQVRVTLSFKIDASLGPNVEAKPVKAPYFVVVMTGGKILAKEVFPVTLAFASGKDTLAQTETVDKISLPLRAGVRPDYEILVGFQLTPEQLRAAQNN